MWGQIAKCGGCQERPGLLFERPLVCARFVRRLNRFLAEVDVAGHRERVHIRNSGRLRELLTSGRQVWLEPSASVDRATRFTLALTRTSAGYVSLDAHLPNRLVEAALRRGRLPGFRGYRLIRREPRVGANRADFLLGRGGRQCLVEVKSVSLVRQGIALFPDAPTLRGRTHLGHLIAARRCEMLAAVVFVIQRADVRAFAPHREADPGFAELLARCGRAGVRALALACRVTPRGIWIAGRVPVRMDGAGRRPPAAPS